MKVHNKLVLLTFVYGNEIWALRIKDKITDIKWEEIFQKNCWGTRFDHKRNEEILEELKNKTK